MSGNNIKVVCRFRPQNSIENEKGGTPIVTFEDEETVKLDSKEYPGSFAFDRVFPWTCTQKEIYNFTAEAIIDDVMKGYNGTVFAYGQTGSGKTFTMMGSSIDDEKNKGLIPRLVESIFNTIMNSSETIEFTVKVSFMEIYMEKIRDLLDPANDNLPIHEDKIRGVYVKGLCEVYVASQDDVFEVMRRGTSERIVSATNMNAESSRSHSIFVVTIQQKNLLDNSSKSGKLYLVDLAGSEKVGKTGASGQTLEEAKKINKSLSALGMVINALTDGKSSHVPYRDSKLTRILQESLGGNSRTTLIINCSPSSYNESETLSTLRFGMRAKKIKNKAKVNADQSPAELKRLLSKIKADLSAAQQYIAALEEEIAIWRSGGKVDEDKYAKKDRPMSAISAPQLDYLTAQSSESLRASTPILPLSEDEKDEILRHENELSDELAEKEAELQRLRFDVEQLKSELADLQQDGESKQDMTGKINEATQRLEKANYETKEALILAESLKESNAELTAEVESLKSRVAELEAAQERRPMQESDREKLKKEKAAQMMQQFDNSDVIAKKESEIRETLTKIQRMEAEGDSKAQQSGILSTGPASQSGSGANDEALKMQLETIQTKYNELLAQHQGLATKKIEMDVKYQHLEEEYEQLLEQSIQDEELKQSEVELTLGSLKDKLETQYQAKREHYAKELEETKEEVARKDIEISRLQKELAEGNNSQNGMVAERDKELERLKTTMAQQLADFDIIRKSLMRDLQNRCEKVVELEISLDDARDQYNQVLRSSSSKAQQKKMVFLEKNLEQLTSVQKQLVDQNTALKRELNMAERKLAARNERIHNLEMLLQDAQDNIQRTSQRFEGQLAALKNRLQEARSSKPQPFLFGDGRIANVAKPIRGGSINNRVSDLKMARAGVDIDGDDDSSQDSTTSVDEPPTPPVTESPEVKSPTKVETPTKTGWLGSFTKK